MKRKTMLRYRYEMGTNTILNVTHSGALAFVYKIVPYIS